VALEAIDTGEHRAYSHQNEDIVRLTPAELRRKMAEKDAARAAAAQPAGEPGR
jgi:hypothetical protein